MWLGPLRREYLRGFQFWCVKTPSLVKRKMTPKVLFKLYGFVLQTHSHASIPEKGVAVEECWKKGFLSFATNNQ